MILKTLLKQVANSQQQEIPRREAGMKREALRIFNSSGSHVSIVSGIRRCGKSTLFLQYLKSKHSRVFYLNFDDPRLVDFETADWEKIDELIMESKCRELFFDEIQLVREWERYVRRKHDQSFKVFVTGSNAAMLSRELGTKLTGRHISKELFPFSYTEFVQFKKRPVSEKSVSEYMNEGGFPEFLKTGNPDVLTQLFNDILIRDIAVRYGVRDIKTLQRMALFLVSNVGNRISGNSLKKQFSFGSVHTVMDYLSHLEMSYLFFFVPRFSYSLKSQAINPRKTYCIDTGLVHHNAFSFSGDLGYKFENMIFLHLRRKTNELYYFSEKQECDFVVCRNSRPVELIQVCYILDNDNLEREVAGLMEAIDFFNLSKGTIVTLNQSDRFRRNGKTILVIPASEFLKK